MVQYTFVEGTKAKASEVNANFQELEELSLTLSIIMRNYN